MRYKSLKDFSLSTKAIDELLGSYQNTCGVPVATKLLGSSLAEPLSVELRLIRCKAATGQLVLDMQRQTALIGGLEDGQDVRFALSRRGLDLAAGWVRGFEANARRRVV